MLPVLVSTIAILAPAPQAKPATNTKCPVMGEKIDPKKSLKVVVRGREYFICCKGCAAKLEKDPGQYLLDDAEGTPRNAK